ncbi:ATP-grasp domain-containing protein [Alkalibacillus haloalkaliphilus]|uniref:ATP-grasp domain-containing protein n=1 Tax=Alkalibacillus haloalkaliphilus TaxID=94136 RepID=UPI0029354F6D|nr:ATP-grasp domain-containing protein [Alkalibacillus haloalkaliphilus]MDV2583321.1 ATP-grasp domain-containing protein [Alkalibacillus haloalkaliphilus]
MKRLEALPEHVTSQTKGSQLDAFSIALEGWRRGLELKFYNPSAIPSGISVKHKNIQGRVFSLSNQNRTHYFYRSRGDLVSDKAVEVCKDKFRTKSYLKESGVPTPQGTVFTLNEDIVNKVSSLGVTYPLVLKPVDGSKGKDVYTDIGSEEELVELVQKIRNDQGAERKFIIEEYFKGEDYRLYVVGDQVVGACYRIPPTVIGDGHSTIDELIKYKNNERKKVKPYYSTRLITVNKELINFIKKGNLSLESVPEKDEKVQLRNVNNVSIGGEPVDVTTELSNDVKQIAVNALKALPDMSHGGVDLILDKNDSNKAQVIEINSTAILGMHLFPIHGDPRDIPSAIIDFYFPETKKSYKNNNFFMYHEIIKPLNDLTLKEITLNRQSFNDKVTIYRIDGSFKKRSLSAIKKFCILNNINGEMSLYKSTLNIALKVDDVSKVKRFEKVISKMGYEIHKEIYNASDYPLEVGFKEKLKE